MASRSQVGDIRVSTAQVHEHSGLQHMGEGVSGMVTVSGSEQGGQLHQIHQDGPYFSTPGTEGVNVLQVSMAYALPVPYSMAR